MSCTEIIRASQARYVNQYKTLKSNVLTCCANICSNHQSLKQNLTPNHTKTETPNTSPAATCTKRKTLTLMPIA